MARPPRRREPAARVDLTDELWTPAHVARYLHCGRSTAYTVLRRPGFPTPVRGGSRQLLWVGREVRAWLLSTGRVRIHGDPYHASGGDTGRGNRRRSQ